ncbi:MAG: hypothetical protein EBY32_16590 [Proteobacteria bacterium]|nr:hypothetical protein [Pseudomonadota bacterium]
MASQANAEFLNPFTSELAQDSEIASPTRSANDPAGTLRADHIGLGSDGGDQLADSMKFLEGHPTAS